ncbi:phosphate acetyltransferase [Oceanicella actignis]|uniref:phosphate acetyltransferase n=1 Tax=Oceanicella actignis TaxID=1189325 RepID=UPI0011E68831|nr:phosphate acetyltransferase [Oceanicella actignis]TYO91301.1 hypothetical protein LY05_00152 [Oceanicella actignis]
MLTLGQAAEIERRFGRDELAGFAALSGAPGAPPGHVPEPLVASLFSYLLGVRLPGPGTNYLKQELRFLAPSPLDEPLTARVEIVRLRPDKHLVDLATTCRDGAGRLICEGRALVLARDVAGAFARPAGA